MSVVHKFGTLPSDGKLNCWKVLGKKAVSMNNNSRICAHKIHICPTWRLRREDLQYWKLALWVTFGWQEQCHRQNEISVWGLSLALSCSLLLRDPCQRVSLHRASRMASSSSPKNFGARMLPRKFIFNQCLLRSFHAAVTAVP